MSETAEPRNEPAAPGGESRAGGGRPGDFRPRGRRARDHRAAPAAAPAPEPRLLGMDYAHNPPHRAFRQGVAAVVLDAHRRVLVCERLSPAGSWQFVQGGIGAGESEEQALVRELAEEIGVFAHDVQVVACVLPRFRYTLRKTSKHYTTKGQEHRYYVVQLRDGARLDLGADHKPEFRRAKFVPAAEFPFDSVFDKKRGIYWDVLSILEPLIGPLGAPRPAGLEAEPAASDEPARPEAAAAPVPADAEPPAPEAGAASDAAPEPTPSEPSAPAPDAPAQCDNA